MKTFSFLIFSTLPFWPFAASAQLNVLISGGFSGAYEQLLPEFERTSGIKVTTGSGASSGNRAADTAARHRGKDQRQGCATRHRRNRHGRRRRRRSCGHADQ